MSGNQLDDTYIDHDAGNPKAIAVDAEQTVDGTYQRPDTDVPLNGAPDDEADSDLLQSAEYLVGETVSA